MITIIGASLLAVSAVGWALWKMAVKGQTPKRASNHVSPKFPFEDITFTSGSKNVNGWWIPSKQKLPEGFQAPLIILVHGWGSSRSRMIRYVAPLYQAGYSLLMFDVRSHGDSDTVSALTVKTFRDDVIAAIHFCKSRTDVDPENIGILGHSFGGFGSTLALKEDLNIKALVTDSMPVQFSTIMKASLKRYKLPYAPVGFLLSKIMFWRAEISKKELKELNAISALEQRKTPVLLVHSKNDDYVPSTELDYIFKNICTKIDHLQLDTPGHSNSQNDPRFWEHVIPFFNQHLG